MSDILGTILRASSLREASSPTAISKKIETSAANTGKVVESAPTAFNSANKLGSTDTNLDTRDVSAAATKDRMSSLFSSSEFTEAAGSANVLDAIFGNHIDEA